jgi:transposase InsO family protein
LEIFQAIGPHVGLPTLQGLFPQMPRCELLDLQRAYRRHYRETNRQFIDQLTWTLPGRVWAMDHAQPPRAIDGIYPAIFAVRDLASGMQLAWLPVPDETADTMLPILEALFDEHGPPLVLKSDNGSAFICEGTGHLLRQHAVVHLLSPPGLPSYNGSCEAGIGSMKVRTLFDALKTGLPGRWTADNLEAARRQANEVHRADANASTAALRWEARTAATSDERQTFRETIDRHRSDIMASHLRKNLCTSTLEEATITRIAIRHALVEHGMLTLNRRSIPLPIKPNNLAKIT